MLNSRWISGIQEQEEQCFHSYFQSGCCVLDQVLRATCIDLCVYHANVEFIASIRGTVEGVSQFICIYLNLVEFPPVPVTITVMSAESSGSLVVFFDIALYTALSG